MKYVVVDGIGLSLCNMKYHNRMNFTKKKINNLEVGVTDSFTLNIASTFTAILLLKEGRFCLFIPNICQLSVQMKEFGVNENMSSLGTEKEIAFSSDPILKVLLVESSTC